MTSLSGGIFNNYEPNFSENWLPEPDDLVEAIDQLAESRLLTTSILSLRDPVYIDGNSFSFPSLSAIIDGIAVEFSTPVVVDLTTQGLNGIDDGLVVDNIFYTYIVAKEDGSSPGLIVSTVNEYVSGSIIMPDDYVLKKQIPFTILRQSGSIVPFIKTGNIMYYLVAGNLSSPTLPRTQVLNAGSATVFTSVDCSPYTPNLPGAVIINSFCTITDTIPALVVIKTTGIGVDTTETSLHNIPAEGKDRQTVLIHLNSDREFEYKWGAAYLGRAINFFVFGFVFSDF